MKMMMVTALLYDEEMTKYKLLWRLLVSYEALERSGAGGSLRLHPPGTGGLGPRDPAGTQNIYHCAKLAVGATLQLVDRVMTGNVRNGMALVRPPGHHSQHSAANGFCVFNNVAIAAQYAKKHHGAKRVLIVDWDVHHGQGVQYCFEEDPSVLYFSWHRYEHQNFWPNLRESDFDSVGRGKGAGFNVNVPWNQVGMDNSDYLAVFFHVLLPIAYEFGPDLVFICAGFDSAIGDPEGHMCATPDIFGHLTHLLMNLADGRVCAVLEGGYNLTSLAQSVCQTVHTLLGDPSPHPAPLGGPCQSALESVHSARSVHKKHWSCLKHAAAPFPGEPSTKHCRLGAATQDGSQGPQSTGGGGGDAQKEPEKKEEEEIVWPEPLPRVAPPIRTALVLPDTVACPDGCARFSAAAEGPDPLEMARLRTNFLKESDDEARVTLLYNLTALVRQMEKNEIRNGLALVPDVSTAAALLTSTSLSKRLEPREGAQSKYYVPITLKKGCGDGGWNTASLMQAVLGLLLPLGYQHRPGLVLLVRPPGGCQARGDLWLQLTGLLQGLARGHTLALVQEKETASVDVTASCLLGHAAPSLGPLAAPEPEDVEGLERLRLRLQTDWPLLQTTAPDKTRSNVDD
ncbi:hypothetical protein CRUP_036507 [Coryphaenoides rupestris]|nr:hypothetical protein CRUP_036507 [Coryphaenoides rupestris]